MLGWVLLCLAIPMRAICDTLTDNSIKGSPLIKCDEHLVRVYFETEKPFHGHVYVRGFYHDDNCHRDYVKNKDNFGSMTVPFEKCGMKRHRMGKPKGMMMAATIITTFHRTFITARDKAFNIQCFYMEQEQVVTQNLDISELPAITLHSNPPMPECQYQVLDSQKGGSEVRFARVGDRLYHRWMCRDDFLKEMYCMIIRNCYVDDGSTNAFELLDDQGCSRDDVLLEDLTYTSDLTANVETTAFKYADRPTLVFSCQVQLSLKHEHPNEKCPRPRCGGRVRSRTRRNVQDANDEDNNNNASTAEIDVNTPQLLILDLEDEPEYIGNGGRSHGAATENLDRSSVGSWRKAAICLSTLSFGILSSFIASLALVMIALLSVIFCRKLRSKHVHDVFD